MMTGVSEWIVSPFGWELACGDCFEIMAQMPDGSFDSVITDPPEGMMGKLLPEALRVSRGPVVMLDPVHALGAKPRDIERDIPKHEDHVVWLYMNRSINLAGIGRIRIWRASGPWDGAILDFFEGTGEELRIHRGAKPVTLMRELVDKLGGGSVLDPMCGYCSTGMACLQLGLQFTGIEINHDNWTNAKERMEKSALEVIHG